MSAGHIFKEVRAGMILGQMDAAVRRMALSRLAEGCFLSESLERMTEEKKSELESILKSFSPEKEIERALAGKYELISIGDPRYPGALREIDDAPLLLYARGKTEWMREMCFAVVGARHASFCGVEQARRFARVLSDSGMTVVSGMAMGIDQAAHEAALEGASGTIAVLGCGADVVYPAVNEPLYRKIAERGLILSEYPLGAEPRAYHFPRRNRILSGLSLGVMVVEAHERSGSLITAYQALEQGREVFALPGPVHHITSRGTHRLIREGAALVETPEEILMAIKESIFFARKREVPQDGVGEQADEPQSLASTIPNIAQNKILDLILSQNRDYEGLLELSGMAPGDFARAMTELEVEGKVRKNLAGYYEAG